MDTRRAVDALGVRIFAGDTVAYAMTHRGKGDIAVGVVTGFVNRKWCGLDEMKATITRVFQAGHAEGTKTEWGQFCRMVIVKKQYQGCPITKGEMPAS